MREPILYRPSDSHALKGKLQERLKEVGWTVVSETPTSEDDCEAIGMAELLGPLRHSFSTDKHRSRDVSSELGPIVYDVRRQDKPFTTSTPISQTSRAFDCHTDEYFLRSPARYVVLLCCVPDQHGLGANIVVHVDDLITALPMWAVAQLQEPVFPSHTDPKAILSHEDSMWTISYNRHQIEQQSRSLRKVMSERMIGSLDLIDRAAVRLAQRILLKSGECLILDNRRMLHGREALPEDSRRHLKRIRVG